MLTHSLQTFLTGRTQDPDIRLAGSALSQLATRGSLVVLLGVAMISHLPHIGATPVEAFTFSTVTDPANPIVTDGGHTGSRYYGASWIDYDGDDDLDLFVDVDALYRNDGGGSFTRVLGSGLGDGQVTSPGFSMSGNSWGDYDNDGDLDAFIAGEASYLYRNDGSDTFTRITTGAIGGGTANRGWTCAWGDYDDDGNLDLVIIHPAGFIPGGPALPNMLFKNDGPPNYTFTQVFSGPIVTGLDSYTVGSWSDYDCDGDIDFFIGSGPAGAVQPDNLYRNLLVESGTATFERILDAPIGSESQDGQLWNWIDYDNDRDLDAFVTNWNGGVGGLNNRLYRQESDGSFTSITDQPLTTDTDVSLASLWGDFDNDGDLDCYVGNDGAGPSRLYENNGDGTFNARVDTPISVPVGARRGGCLGDYDNDGDLDLFANGPLALRALYRNDSPASNFLTVTLAGSPTNRSAIGAKVHAHAVIDGNPVWQMREVSGQNSFQGHNSLRVHFGFGDATSVDSLVVEWPGGGTSELTGVGTNQFIVMIEGGTADAPDLEPLPDLEVSTLPNPFVGETRIGFSVASDSPVEVAVHDVHGRRVRTLISGYSLPQGRQQILWDGTSDEGTTLPGGIYLYRVRQGNRQESGSLTLMR